MDPILDPSGTPQKGGFTLSLEQWSKRGQNESRPITSRHKISCCVKSQTQDHNSKHNIPKHNIQTQQHNTTNYLQQQHSSCPDRYHVRVGSLYRARAGCTLGQERDQVEARSGVATPEAREDRRELRPTVGSWLGTSSLYVLDFELVGYECAASTCRAYLVVAPLPYRVHT